MTTFLTRRAVTTVGTWLPRAAAPFFPDILWRMPPKPKTAYLTFDDGPNTELSNQILEILDRHGALASFFMIGAKAERHPDLVRAMDAAGHTVGNHSYSHPDPWKTGSSAMLEQLDRTSHILEDILGRRLEFLRPPYGRFTRPIRSWCIEHQQRLTMWDVGPGDYLEAMSINAVAREVIRYLRPGSVVVLHDNPRRAADTPAALDRLLTELMADGWTFASLQ